MTSLSKLGLLVVAALALAAPMRADSKAETMKPAEATKSLDEAALKTQLEAKYAAELEKSVAAERQRYEGSLRSLWLSNAAVWTVLMLFIVLQALSARKRAAELERLRAAREGGRN